MRDLMQDGIANMFTISVPPMVEVEREVVKARIGGNATLKCKSQAFPPSENFWTLTSHEPISSGEGTGSKLVQLSYQTKALSQL